ncbi:MAG: extracellular solute-binding protein, partial [Paracoccaceae bacterium]|nr:extracellular solute-binding protein [Paracoccaceae bacterium]
MKKSSLLLAGVAASVLALPALAGDPELLVFDWAGFEEEGLFATYKEKYGDGPSYTFYGDDDEAYQKLASGFKADVAHPCSQMVSKYRDAGLIEPWDTSKIPEFANIDPKYLASPIFKDDGGVWYIPTDWGATAIAYNPEEVPAEDVASLDVFLNPKYEGRTSIPDSSDDVWALAYLATGVTDWTVITDAQFNAAADWLRKAHKNVRSYWADPAEQAQLMASGEVLVAWSWNDGVAYLQDDNYPVAFQREAKEGSSTWFCGFVNLKDGPGSEDKAFDFINSWLRPEAGPALLDAIGYGHT